MSSQHDNSSLLLKFLFPGFTSPKESRFVKYFNVYNKEQKKNFKKKSEKSLFIESINIINGKDKRTTIIIKNLPNDITKEALKAIIEPLGNINFIYIPLLIKNKNKLNFPCAYINVINYKTILKIIEKFKELKYVNKSENNNNFSNVDIFYSRTQGRRALINRFSLEKKFLPPNQEISFS